MEEPLSSLLKASWQSAVLILLVLAAQRLFGQRLSPRWRYMLWLLVMIRLAFPLTLPSGVSVFNVLNFSNTRPSWRETTAATSKEAVPTEKEATGANGLTDKQATASRHRLWRTGAGPTISWPGLVWAAGALSLASCLLITHYRLYRKIRHQRPLTNAAVLDLLEDCKQEMGVRTPVTVIETGVVASPSLFGFVRPRLLLPAGLLQTFSLDELRYILLHELAHIKRQDILASWLVAALQILHWFNPVVWLGFYRMRVDRELACDALALSRAREKENERYGNTIIKVLESFGRCAWAPSLAGAAENKNQLKERITMISKFKRTNPGFVLTVALLSGLGLITFTDAEPKGSETGKGLLGTWILVGAPGHVGSAPAAGGRLKSFTDSQWSITQADPQSGVTVFHHGGSYSLNGNDYTEHIEFANENTKYLIGNTPKFTVNLEGDTFTQVGNGWKEVWKRVRPDSIKPKPINAAPLEGAWNGKESGKSDGECSLVVKGTTFEFHGADKKEWYKASFLAYDTTPKQMVIVIKDCPIPDYKGLTSHAIYKLEDGALTIAGNEPGFPAAPADFDSPDARKIVFTQK